MARHRTTTDTEDTPLAERRPYKAVEQAEDRLQRRESVVIAEGKHETRCTLNAAGTGETTETSHRVVAHVPPERVEEFREGLRLTSDLGFESSHQEGRGRGDTDRFVFTPRSR